MTGRRAKIAGMGDLVDLLSRPVYGFSQVDALLSLRAGTAQRWIDGYERRGQHYRPVVRIHTTNDPLVTWGEFVEARLLAQYRDAGVPMIRMRPVVERLREELGLYPLARVKPYAHGQELVAAAQNAVGLEDELRIVVVLRTGQTALAPRAAEFLVDAEWDTDVDPDQQVIARFAPGGRDSSVVIDPEYGFGEPCIRGRNVRTDVLAEALRAGDAPGWIADGYDLPLAVVEEALDYERARQVA
jgi:uncharacterized protein (DUF433 family)